MAVGINDYEGIKFSRCLDENMNILRNIFKNDALVREKSVVSFGINYKVFYIDGMTDSDLINDSVIRPLVTVKPEGDCKIAELIANRVLFSSEVQRTSNVTDALRAVLYGDTLLLIDGSSEVITINTKGWRTRGISEPEDERVLKGPREGFDEAALLNIAMIRRKLLTPDFCVEMQRIGRRTDTLVFICYLDSLISKKMLKLLKKRLSLIDMDGILDVNYITEQIRDNPFSIFQTTGSTERPDVAAAAILEGRIAVVVDGTPVVMTVPYLFSENFQSDEDYYLNFFDSSIGRILRYVCFFLSFSVPAVFISLITFNKELLPTEFAISIAQLRGGVPFASVFECIILIIVFEILRETGFRMPQGSGTALSIAGGLVIGQAAVEAKIVSAPMLIAVAFSGLCTLTVPRVRGAMFYLRIGFAVLASLFGFLGFFAGLTLLSGEIFSLKSFGVDETEALKDIKSQSLKDVFIRSPWLFMRTRPIFNSNKVRMRRKSKK